jgi:hypothetical protein
MHWLVQVTHHLIGGTCGSKLTLVEATLARIQQLQWFWSGYQVMIGVPIRQMGLKNGE